MPVTLEQPCGLFETRRKCQKMKLRGLSKARSPGFIIRTYMYIYTYLYEYLYIYNIYIYIYMYLYLYEYSLDRHSTTLRKKRAGHLDRVGRRFAGYRGVGVTWRVAFDGIRLEVWTCFDHQSLTRKIYDFTGKNHPVFFSRIWNHPSIARVDWYGMVSDPSEWLQIGF